MSPKKKIQRITHAPLPWKRYQEEEEVVNPGLIISNNGNCILSIGLLMGEKEGMVNLKFVLGACNAHYKLLKACKRALRELKPRLDDPPAKKRLCLQLGKAIHQAEKVIK